MGKPIAWTYMVSNEEGLTKTQLQKLLDLIPQGVEVIPFSNDDSGLLEANSIAYGFIEESYFDDYLPSVKQTLARVCNDWALESSDETYTTPDGLKVMMFSDYETILVGERTEEE